jgi:hypothetical protein
MVDILQNSLSIIFIDTGANPAVGRAVPRSGNNDRQIWNARLVEDYNY